MGTITTEIGDTDGSIGAVDIVNVQDGMITRDFTVGTSNVEHGQQIVERLRKLQHVEVVNVSDGVFLMPVVKTSRHFRFRSS